MQDKKECRDGGTLPQISRRDALMGRPTMADTPTNDNHSNANNQNSIVEQARAWLQAPEHEEDRSDIWCELCIRANAKADYYFKDFLQTYRQHGMVMPRGTHQYIYCAMLKKHKSESLTPIGTKYVRPEAIEANAIRYAKTWQWCEGNTAAYGKITEAIKRAYESGKKESVRRLTDNIAFGFYSSDDGERKTEAGHYLSAAVARIVVAEHPEWEDAIDLRPSPLDHLDPLRCRNLVV